MNGITGISEKENELLPGRTGGAERTIAMDFDDTLINGHVLTNWVRFVFLKSDLTLIRKLVFLTESFFRGMLSMLLASWPATSEWAVKCAFNAFRGIDVSTVDKMINYRGDDRKFVIDLNSALLEVLESLLSRGNPVPDIEIHSQGSFMYAIRTLLSRNDVKHRLETYGISPESITIIANNLEINDNGRFTGKLIGVICTKFSRTRKIKNNALFIGDDKDEAVIRKFKAKKFRFINWKHRRA